MPSDPDPSFDHCPFCGMRLPPEGLDGHVEEYDNCAARLDAYGRASDSGIDPLDDESGQRRLSLVQKLLLAVIVTVVFGYSLLISQQLLLGLFASGIVVVAFLVGSRR